MTARGRGGIVGAMAVDPEPKLGLALSGGGHRAAFFHIGVLAALAELGLLRKVRVLSTVSGGSCIGALYYLHVKRLLESTPDGDIDDERFRDLVRDVAIEYRDAVAKNLLARAYLNPLKNFKMALPWYSRTVRAGEILERQFYRQAWNGPLERGRIPMRELCIRPGGESIDPDTEENARRNAPVPILLLESTTMNTGHNWRFEAEYMGEPPRQSAEEKLTDVDKNVRLARAKWSELPPKLQDFPLGMAVASSAAFPGGFVPVQIRNLYPGVVVELTDGGVHDNQGVEGLVDRDCTHVILSDGSGQMPDVDKPGTWVPKVLERVVSIYGDAEREERLLRAFAEEKWAFFHLQSGLPNRIREPGEAPEDVPGGMSTWDFGVKPETQRLIARVRTNLDAFCDLEAWSLAKDGHAIAAHVLPGQNAFANLPDEPPREGDWPWEPVDLANPSARLLRALAWGKLELPLGLFGPLGAMILGAIGVGSWLLLHNGPALLGISLGTLLAVALYLGPALPGMRIVSAFLYESVMPALLALPLFIASLVLLGVGKLWLWYGRAPASPS